MPSVTEKNRNAVVGFGGLLPSQESPPLFVDESATYARAGTFTVVQVNGGVNNPSFPNGQAKVEIQYTTAMAFPTPLIFYSIGGVMRWAPDGMPIVRDTFLKWFNHIPGGPTRNILQTASMSYTVDKWDLPIKYAADVCQLFSQLGARGVSVLVANSNNGIRNGNCEDNEGNVGFIPLFPSSCTCGILSPLPSSTSCSQDRRGFTGPWVTSVGSTRSFPEVVASFSGCGFLTYFAHPRYRFDVMPGFLQAIGTQHAGLFKCAWQTMEHTRCS